VLGFGSLAVAAWNHMIVGLLVLAFAAWELWDVRQKATA
jgi:SPW repeat